MPTVTKTGSRPGLRPAGCRTCVLPHHAHLCDEKYRKQLLLSSEPGLSVPPAAEGPASHTWGPSGSSILTPQACCAKEGS